MCELLCAIKPAKIDRLIPHITAIASLHSGPADAGAVQVFSKLVSPDQPSRIVRLLGNTDSRVRLMCLIAMEPFSGLPLNGDIWGAVGTLQTDATKEVRAIASLMVKNQFQPGGAMYQQAEGSFTSSAAAQASDAVLYRLLLSGPRRSHSAFLGWPAAPTAPAGRTRTAAAGTFAVQVEMCGRECFCRSLVVLSICKYTVLS